MEELGAQLTEDEEKTEFHRQSLSEAIRMNALAIFEDMPPFQEELIDELFQKNCLSKDDLNYAGSDSDKQKARKLLIAIMKRSYEVMETFLQCMKPFHKHLVKTIYRSFHECMKWMEIKLSCSFCFLKESVCIKTVADVTWSADFIPLPLYKELIADSKSTTSLWKMFAEHCNNSKDVKKVITTIQRNLEPRQYSELVQRLPLMHKFICECDSLKTDKAEKKLHRNLMEWRSPQQAFGHTERIKTEYKASFTEVDGCYSHNQRVADEHQDERMSDTKSEQRKRLCLKKAFRLNKLALIDNMTIHLRKMKQV